jgi:exonuclease 3'-5' domain-containing protein 1
MDPLVAALEGLRVGGGRGAGADPAPLERINLQVVNVNGARVCMVSTVAALAAVTARLSACPAVAVDLEGVDLGRQGRVATLQLCGATRDVTYIVDVVTLGSAAFSAKAGLRALLESATIKKLFFDVRTDANALHHLHGVSMPPASIVDLQLLDVCSAIARGRPLTKLGGLGFLLERTPHGGLSAAERGRMAVVKQSARGLFSPELGGSYGVWLQRPLTRLLLEYAADVRFFHALERSLSDAIAGLGNRVRGALLAAVTRRLELAHGLAYSPANREANIVVDADLVAAVSQLPAIQRTRLAPASGGVLFKTRLCRFWTAGSCSNGAGCTYAHGEWELRRAAATGGGGRRP